MNINDLAKLDVKDIKNIDYSVVLANLQKKPGVLAQIIVILVTIAFCFFYYTNRRNEFDTINIELTQLKSKEEIFDKYENIQDALKNLKSVLPTPIAEAQLIEFITGHAETDKITIESFSPAQKNSYDMYNTITLSFQANTDSYAGLFNFIKALETEKKTIRVASFTAQPGSQRENRRRLRFRKPAEASNASAVSANISVTVINFKHE